MKKVMRTLLILEEKSSKLLYGHSISWVLSDIDYIIKEWRRFNSGGITAYFKDIEDEESIFSSIEDGFFDLPENSKATFNFQEKEEFFIEKSYEEPNFNPFIGLCTYAEVHFQDGYPTEVNPVDYGISNREDMEAIKDKYKVDLLASPHLMGSFTIFNPTRIDESFKGVENNVAIGYEVALLDYFDLYKNAEVSLEAICGDKSHKTKIVLDRNLHTINCGFVPDKHTTQVIFGGKVIYKSSFNLVKHISVQTSIISEKKIISGDKVIHQRTSTRSNFDV